MKKIVLNIALGMMVFGLSAQVDRSKMPEAGPAPKIELGEIQSFTMENGLKVFVVENHKLPRVTYSLELDLDPIKEGDKVGMADLAGDMLSKGTANRTKDELNFEIDYIGANFGTGASSMFGRALTKHQEKLLEIMSDVIMNPSFDEEELDKLKKQYISGIQTEKDDPDAIASNVRRVLLYGKDHPYGEIMTEETVNNVNLEDLKNYFSTYWRPNVAYLAVVGDINLKEAKTLVKKYFGKWEKKEVPSYEYDFPNTPEQMQVAFVNKPGAVQSVISVFNPIELQPGAEDVIPATITNGILGGGFVSKLNLNLREEHSYTYGARSSIRSDEEVGYFLASAKVRNEVTDSALTETMKELKEMRDGNVSADELKTIKNYRTGTFAYSLENPQTKANFAINIDKYDLPKDYYASYLEKVASVSLEDVERISQNYIKPSNGYMLVVGNQEEVAAKVKPLSPNGEITFLDIYGNEVEETTTKSAPEGVTAQSVIEDYIKAVGGADAINKIKSLSMTYAASMNGQEMQMKQVSNLPDQYLQEMSMGGGAMIIQKQILNGDKGVKQSMQTGKADLTEEEVAELKSTLLPVAEMNYLKDGYELELKGMDQKMDQETYIVSIKKPNGDEITNYYSAESGLLVATVQMVEMPDGSKAPDETGFDNYAAEKGVKFPMNIIVSAGPRKLTFELKELEVNSKVDKSIFSLE